MERSFNSRGRARFRVVLAVLGCLALAHAMEAPLTAYLKIGDIAGESQAEGHEQWVIIESMSSPIFRSVSLRQGVRIPGTTQFGDVTLKRGIPSTTPPLLDLLASGTVIPEVIIDFTESTPQGEQTYYQYKLAKALISSYSIHGSADDGALPSEEITLNYTKADWYYREISPDGEVLSQAGAFWDVETNTGGSLENNPPSVEFAWAKTVQPGEVVEEPLHVRDLETPAAELTVTASTDNPELVLDLEVIGDGEERSLRFRVSPIHSGSASVNISVSDGIDSTSTAFTVMVGVEMTPFESFLRAYFSEEELLDDELVSPIGDPDGDLLQTVMEFGLGTNPREFTETSEAIRVTRENTPEGPILRLEFQRRKDAGTVGPIPWMAPESLRFQPLGNNPLYEENTQTASNPLYDDVEGIIPLDPDAMDAHYIRMQIEVNW